MGTSYLAAVSRFDSATAMWIVLVANLVITLIHILQEWKGEEVPLWRVFGGVEGVYLPHWLGFASFTLGLTALLWLAGVVGICGLAGIWWGMLALGFVIGGRISDSVVSHWSLYMKGYRPNPGLSSTVLYILEAAFLLWAFWKGLSSNLVPALIGAVVGAGLFVAVRPILRLVGEKIPAWRRDPWIAWQPIPDWTKVPD